MGKQVRSIGTYTKINTYMRDSNNGNIIIDGAMPSPELQWIYDNDIPMDWEEKIDGTNTRIEVTLSVKSSTEPGMPMWSVFCSVEYKGKTDNAQMPKLLVEHLTTNYPEDKVLAALGLAKQISLVDANGEITQDAIDHKWVNRDDKGNIVGLRLESIPNEYVLYGEGYGKGIQGCGGSYLKDSVSFIGFDVRVDNVYLLRANRDEIFTKLGAPIVPFIGTMSIREMDKLVDNGWVSEISEDRTFIAEGAVGRLPLGMLTRMGARIMFKDKVKDRKKLKK